MSLKIMGLNNVATYTYLIRYLRFSIIELWSYYDTRPKFALISQTTIGVEIKNINIKFRYF